MILTKTKLELLDSIVHHANKLSCTVEINKGFIYVYDNKDIKLCYYAELNEMNKLYSKLFKIVYEITK